MRRWPLFAPLAVVLIETRALVVETPSLTSGLRSAPSSETVRYINDRIPGLVVGGGLTLLGLACFVVFIAGLSRAIRLRSADSIAAPLVLLGGGITAGAVFVGIAFFWILIGAASESPFPPTVASVYTIFDSLGYVGWTALGIVTGAVAFAALREGVLPRWLGWVSAVTTVLFVAAVFLPVVAWAPALLWLLIAGVGLSISERAT